MDVEKTTKDAGIELNKSENGEVTLHVAGSTDVGSLAGAITHAFAETHTLVIRTIGAGAVNQAIKGIAKARGYIAAQGRDLIVRPGFGETKIDNDKRTVIILICKVI